MDVILLIIQWSFMPQLNNIKIKSTQKKTYFYFKIKFKTLLKKLNHKIISKKKCINIKKHTYFK